MDLSGLRGIHAGETVWVFGSGGTLNHVDPKFFADKVTVSTNLGPVRFGVERPTFVFTHYWQYVAEALELGSTVVTLACHWQTKEPWPHGDHERLVLIPHDTYDPPGDVWNPNTTHRPRPDSLVFGSSSLHGAMHLAGWVGASHIMMVGADCGILDGQSNLAGYNSFNTDQDRERLLSLYERDHRRMKEYLVGTFGTPVYSLNPFINLNLEGHTFTGPGSAYL